MMAQESSSTEILDTRSLELRRDILEAVYEAGRGHIGPSLSVLEIISTLYDSILNHDPLNPNWPERDIFILSKGHGCLALYAVLAQHGYFPKNELKTFCKYDSRLGGHPEWHNLPGIEFSTGSLGHGLAVAVGIAKAFQLKDSKRRIFVILGDGELGEGSIWESAAHSAKHKLNNLYVIIDFNKLQAYGDLEIVLPLGDLTSKWNSFGFEVQEIDGHSRIDLIKSMRNFSEENKPKLIIAHTTKGKGIAAAENSMNWHHKAKISKDEVNSLMRDLS